MANAKKSGRSLEKEDVKEKEPQDSSEDDSSDEEDEQGEWR